MAIVLIKAEPGRGKIWDRYHIIGVVNDDHVFGRMEHPSMGKMVHVKVPEEATAIKDRLALMGRSAVRQNIFDAAQSVGGFAAVSSVEFWEGVRAEWQL